MMYDLKREEVEVQKIAAANSGVTESNIWAFDRITCILGTCMRFPLSKDIVHTPAS